MGKRQRQRDRTTASDTEPHSGNPPFEVGRYRYEVIPAPDLPEHDRAAALSRIVGLGAERLRLVQELRLVDDQLRPRVQHAVAVGVPYRRIEELTGYSRSAVSRWGSTPSSEEPATP